MGHTNTHHVLFINVGLNYCEIPRQGLRPMLLEKHTRYTFVFFQKGKCGNSCLLLLLFSSALSILKLGEYKM